MSGPKSCFPHLFETLQASVSAPDNLESLAFPCKTSSSKRCLEKMWCFDTGGHAPVEDKLVESAIEVDDAAQDLDRLKKAVAEGD